MNPVVTKIFEGKPILVRNLTYPGKDILRKGDYRYASNGRKTGIISKVEIFIGYATPTNGFFRDAYKEININGVPTRCLILNSDDGPTKQGDVFIHGHSIFTLNVPIQDSNYKGGQDQIYRPMPKEEDPKSTYRLIKINDKVVKCRLLKEEEPIFKAEPKIEGFLAYIIEDSEAKPSDGFLYYNKEVALKEAAMA